MRININEEFTTLLFAPVAEMADAEDLKSFDIIIVLVQVQSGVLIKILKFYNFSPFRHHLLFTNFYNYDTVGISKF